MELKGISKAFDGRTVLTDFSLTVAEGEVVALMGPSGCGKSTLMNIAAGLLSPDAGEITGVEGKRVTYLFSDNRLISHKDAVTNLTIAMEHPDENRAKEALASLALMGEDITKPVKELSFGMARRVAIARAMVHDGEIILYDEPVYGLDEETRKTVLEVLKKHLAGKTGIIITHDEDVAGLLCDRMVLMRKEER